MSRGAEMKPSATCPMHSVQTTTRKGQGVARSTVPASVLVGAQYYCEECATMMRRKLWYASCDGIARMGPYSSEAEAYRKLQLMPRDAETRIVPTNSRARDLGLHLVTTPAILDGTLAPGARVWSE